jgi:OFA family oxalate/formate antiporter-like MFS transporter
MQAAKTMTAVQPGSEPFISRWSIPIAGLLLTLMGGISYAWGVFVVPLTERFGWSRADAMLPLSVYLVVFTTVGMIYGGALQDKYGPRKVAAAGGILFFIAYLMAAQIDRFPYVWWLLLTYGVVGGLGCALAYCVAVPTARKWFPDRTALAVSVAVTGFGLAATIFAPWITRLIRTVGIESTFLVLGAVTSAVTLLAAWVVRNPVAGWVPPGWEVQTGASSSMYAARTEATLAEALKTPLFYFLWAGFFGVIFGGLMAMAHVVPYGVTVLGMPRPAAAIASVYFGLANGFGRPVAGMIAQKVGPVKVMLATYIVTGTAFFLFNGMATTPSKLYLFAFIFGWGFAVTLGLFPSLATISFGAKNLGAIYGALITAFGAAAFFGPMAAAWAYDLYKSYVMPFALAGTLSLIGWLICLFAYRLKYKLP